MNSDLLRLNCDIEQNMKNGILSRPYSNVDSFKIYV